MNIKNILTGLVISLVIIAATLAITNKRIEAQPPSIDPELSNKIEEIRNDQKTILKELAAVRESLYIIKLRVTQNQ
jgi:hypothetical protein